MNIYDIANKSGVSIATVSRVLNNSEKVSAVTRERVLAVMEEFNYTPNAFARGLGLDSMRMIGLLCTDVSDLYYAKAVSLLERELRDHGFDTLLCCTGASLADKKKNLNLLLQKRVDAVVLIGSAFQEHGDNSHIRVAAGRVPVFIINGDFSIPNVYCLLCDEYTAMYNNTELAFKKGHSNIMYIYDSDSFSGRSKLNGFNDGVKKLGINGIAVKTEKSMESAIHAVTDALEKTDFTAVLASEDLLAIGALKAAAKLSRQISVIGFNDSKLAECSSPALTSVDNRLDELCPLVVRMLEELTAGEPVAQKTVLQSRIVYRDTF